MSDVEFTAGPHRVVTNDPDPDFVAKPLLGFSTGIDHQTLHALRFGADVVYNADLLRPTYEIVSHTPWGTVVLTLEDPSNIIRGEN